MTTAEIIMALAQALGGLAVYTVKSELKGLKELLSLRIENAEDRIDRLDRK